MLVAYTNGNKRFVLNTTLPHTTLKQLRKTQQFYCPQCKQRLQLKVGQVKIPHFAHIANSDCEERFSEGESNAHLEGKEHLFTFFQTLNVQVQLEPYLPTIQQRPDLLIFYNNKPIAIEFQCSFLSFERLTERNRGYSSATITPIWIPVTPSKIQTNGIFKLSISKQLQQFILSTNQQQYIMTYSPNLRQFIYLSNLMYLNGNTFIAKVQAIPISKQNFPFYIPKKLSNEEFTNYLMLYNSFKHNYLKSRVLISRQGVNDLFLRSVYELRLHLQNFPIVLGVPIKGSEVVNGFTIEWQTALFYFLLVNQLNVRSLNDGMIHYFLKWAHLNETNDAFRVVKDYCDLLKKLSIQHVRQTVGKQELDNHLYSQFLAIKR
ncbi:competence protein CoiA [Lysinibacillus sp. BW-2-10]|uniref:competence protein CoiA n=1 Tax=Lysinibacillus sp. BW-2-10 TaxID=2590030 RepID=UPI00117D7FA4|nr:competence protein CoiA family protein [Lysinibacillus sp. BW-2-10]TSI04232.1 hypothetical protein FJQ64_14890 [Lysinibacillus sp. BW-2-10]